ncbi:MAG: amidohydrolase family protein [Steroidobacteraceae bacterium]
MTIATKHPSLKLLLASAIGLAGITAAAVEDEPRSILPTGPLDRSSYYDSSTSTSDDLRRVPVPQGYGVPDTSIVIRNARLFDGTGTRARAATLVIAGNRIASVLSPDETAWPPEAEVIDAAGKTVMPGLIDLHTHLTYVFGFGAPPELESESQADAALRGAERLRYYLESGITSVRDVGSHGLAPFILKQWAAEGRIAAPRVFAAGQVIVGEGGHGTEGYGWRTAPAYDDSLVREASGADDWRAAVRRQFKRGADLIKLASHYDETEIRAAVEEAHRLGLRVTVDSETVFTEIAARVGVDSIEHPLPRSDRAIKIMAERGIAAVPTIVPYQYILAEEGGYHGSTSRRFTLTEPRMFEIAGKMKQAGVKLGVGTDLVLDWYRRLPEPYIRELENFRRLGYSAEQALIAATRTNAEILGMADRLGTLEQGKLADIIVVDGRPDADIQDLRKVSMAIVNGRILLRDGHVRVPRLNNNHAEGTHR